MALYSFDITDGGPHKDDTGTECANRDEVRKAAMQTLSAVAGEQTPADGDRRFFSVLVRDQHGKPVYTDMLSFTGMWLDQRQPPPS